MSTNQYDGKSFLITTPGETQADGSVSYAAGYLAPIDGSVPTARIRGAVRGWGNRYQLDPKLTGNADDYVQGPQIGAELDEFLAKRGGVTGDIGGDVAPFADWLATPNKYTEPLEFPITGAPSSPPVDEMEAPATPAPSAEPAIDTAGLNPDNAAVVVTVGQHERMRTLLKRIEQGIASVEDAVIKAGHAALAELRGLLKHT